MALDQPQLLCLGRACIRDLPAHRDRRDGTNGDTKSLLLAEGTQPTPILLSALSEESRVISHLLAQIQYNVA